MMDHSGQPQTSPTVPFKMADISSPSASLVDMFGKNRSGQDYGRSPHSQNRLSSSQRTSAFTPVGGESVSNGLFAATPKSHSGATPMQKKSAPGSARNPNASLVLLSPSRTITESLTSLVSSTAQQLEEVWDEVGYNPEERTSQLSDLLVQFRDLCEAKIAEEQGVAETFRRTIEETKAEILATANALKTSVDDKLMEQRQGRKSTTLTDELAILEATLEGVKETAAIAKREIQESQTFIVEAHEMLGLQLDDTWNDIDSDLTYERRELFRNKAREMKEETATRASAVIQLLRDCQHLMNDLRIDVETEGSVLDTQIAGSLTKSKDATYGLVSNFSTSTCIGIGANALEELTGRVAELNAEKRRRTTKLQQMGVDIMELWEKLNISEEEQRAFSSQIQGLGKDTIAKGESELKRLQALKSEMLGKLVLDSRETIAGLWDDIGATEEFRSAFAPLRVRDEILFTDDLLQQHEDYINHLRARFDEMKPVLKIIERREAILEERKEYQELQKDSDRLKQRGAALTRQLMHEEKMARRIKKDLPKLTAMLIEKLEEWQKNHGEEFLFQGTSYMDVMEAQEDEWNQYKEREQQMKMKKKQEEKSHMKFSINYAPLPGKMSTRSRPLADARSRDNVRSTSRSRPRGDPEKTRTKPARSNSSRVRPGSAW